MLRLRRPRSLPGGGSSLAAPDPTPVTDAGVPPARLLVVCTANVCRSPVGEAVLRHRLGGLGVTASVASAGLPGVARPGAHADRTTAKALSARTGLSLAGHRSSVLDPALVRGADVILTMTREHARVVVALDEGAWPRTFPLRVAVRRAIAVGQRGDAEALDSWTARLHAGRGVADLLGDDPGDDIEDPVGEPLRFHREVTAVIDGLCGQFVVLAFGSEAR
jgi:protein-tyrosine phosphatase